MYSYDAADRIQSAGNTSFDFDDNGNMIRKSDTTGTTRYEYDGENRLTKVILPDNSEVEYHYDPFGNRIAKNLGAGESYTLLPGRTKCIDGA